MTTDPVESDTLYNRENLALTRTRLANERTMLAYTRTAIMLAVTGVTVLKLYGDTSWATVSGWALLVGSLGIGFFGMRRFKRLSEILR